MSSCFDCCDLNSDDTKLEFLIGQVKREVESLKNTTNARMLIQDGKIGATCTYIKNNLDKTLREIIDTMKFNGELDDIVTQAVLNEVNNLENVVTPYGHVKRYGAVGDGVADDTQAIKQACKDALDKGTELIIDKGTYKVTEDIDARYIKNIVATGDIRCVGETQFIIGTNSSSTDGITAEFKRIDNLKCIGLKTSRITFKWCENLNLYANGDSTTDYGLGYNIFNGTHCTNINLFSEGSKVGWINENTFNIRKVINITIDGNNDHNNNHFEHCNLENGTINLLNARNNTFSCRGEGGLTVNTSDNSTCNLIEQEYYFNDNFAKNISAETKGSLTYYPINKLQSERILLQIDAHNRNIPVGKIMFNENGTLKGTNYNEIFHTNLIEITSPFALTALTTSPVLRAQVNFYDENKERILTEVDNVINTGMKYYSEGDWSYYTSSNKIKDTTIIYPGQAKYVEYRVLFGNTVTDYSLSHITVKLLKLVNTDIHISNETKYNVANSVQTEGYWERGTRIYREQATSGDYAGMICVESGTPGVWRNFALIQ